MKSEQHTVAQTLCGIWAELLDVEVAADDDFFELGGYSLLIVDVIAEARKYGITLTADDVFERKTPAAIASALSSTAGKVQTADTSERDPDFAAIWATGLSPLDVTPLPTLTPLSDGGTGTPVFSFHWGAGNVRFLREVVDTFRGGRPVYGVESVGMWNRERPALSIVEMAARYLREIREVQPNGPYLLVGPCAGGRIAFEIARQLEAVDEQVAVLALLNAMPPGTTDLDPSWGLADLYNFRLASLRSQFDVPNLRAGGDRLIKDMTSAAKIDEQMDPADLYWRQAVWAAGNFAQEHYEPRWYGGEAIVFQLAESAQQANADWRRVVATTEVHTFEVADTLPLLRDPSAAELLRKKLAAFPG